MYEIVPLRTMYLLFMVYQVVFKMSSGLLKEKKWKW